MWIYKSLSSDSTVKNYYKENETYRELTSGLSEENKDLLKDKVKHREDWEHQAINILKSLDVRTADGEKITAKMLLEDESYEKYRRRYGAG